MLNFTPKMLQIESRPQSLADRKLIVCLGTEGEAGPIGNMANVESYTKSYEGYCSKKS